MNMWEPWPTAARYWDLVAQAIDDLPNPYFAFVIRCVPPDSGSNPVIRAILDHLPRHPLAERLEFVDPLRLADLAALVPTG